ncbi:MAG: LLM class flavin-dependent oxidoreductase, partial [Candidatus Caldarchaeales archaeon]
MELDAIIYAGDIRKLAELSRAAESAGFHTLWVSETSHDSLIQASVVIQNTERSLVGTGVTVAFARSPTALAYAAWDLQALSGGRFVLGLGSQVKGHIERRFGMKWESPVSKMRETIEAIRAVWRSWQYGEPLRYEGKFYRISLMTPFFDPGPIERPEIPIYLAGVNRAMIKLAGLLCQGLMVHPFHSLKYLKEVVLPSL